MKHLILTLLLGSSSLAMAQSLQEKFNQALNVVADSTAQICDVCREDMAQYGQEAVGQSYETQAVYQQIQARVTTPAQQILLDVSQTIQILANQIIAGTKSPSETNRQAACVTVKIGMDQRRFAAFNEGYRELHQDFVNYLDQFQSITAILSCDLW